jgi:hypothetical protein
MVWPASNSVENIEGGRKFQPILLAGTKERVVDFNQYNNVPGKMMVTQAARSR